jgi:ribosomal protein S18 acetylase RimI-like enzyme
MPTVRRLSVEDYDRILELWRRSGLDSLRSDGRDSRESFSRQQDEGQLVLGLETEGNLIGVVVATHDTRKGWVNRLAIDPDHRRQGYGTLLLRAGEKELRQQGMHIIATLAEDWNEASLALLQKEGYKLDREILYLTKRDWPGA